jgi:hypothetical protein
MLQGLDVSGTEIKKKDDLEVVIVDQSNLGSWFVLQMSTGVFLILIQVNQFSLLIYRLQQWFLNHGSRPF